ncbi:MAG TPA: glycoside hydrolase family 15 protein [Streptosporangiaceae bacterium]|nr:glycoside hydrolase family 15 protein [Streptosporangiaceae bacterium]
MAGRIEDYAIVGDMQSVALISADGSVDWLCLPRFDSEACFAALLGTGHHGQWRIAPGTGAARATRRYAGDTLILETDWETPDGAVRVTDFMPPRENDEPPVLVRIVTGVRGAVDMNVTLRVRFGYGSIVPWLTQIKDGIRASAGPDAIWLRTPVPMTGRDLAHIATFSVAGGESVPFVLTYLPSHKDEPARLDAFQSLDRTRRFWSGWVSRCTYDGDYRDAVIRSLITLKALTYQPTGGIVAAGTTSLPEDIGGVRNWDYRYCWLRDATITLEALLRTGYTEEAKAWRLWLGRAIAGNPRDLQIMYGVAGERRLDEWEADWLPGYENSAPVRIGNAAAGQLQLDVYGEVIDALQLSCRVGLHDDRHTWSLQRSLLKFLEEHWAEADEGLWEVRGPRRHFVHSKVMAWVAFDRAASYAEQAGKTDLAVRWRVTRDEIKREVCEKGYNAERGAFTQYYGATELDASVLLISDVGFLDADDPRIVSTMKVLQRDLVQDGYLRRYELPAGGTSGVDGLPGSEGAFLACSFWLANALELSGRHEEALELFERLLALRNDVGLLSEEYDPRYGRLVGNMPQAFSHVPLVQTALNLSGHAEEQRRGPRDERRSVPG